MCLLLLVYGLQRDHILQVLLQENMPDIPDCLVDKFWHMATDVHLQSGSQQQNVTSERDVITCRYAASCEPYYLTYPGLRYASLAYNNN